MPGTALGVAITLIVRRVHHWAVLPGILMSIPICFYVFVVGIGGMSLEEVRAHKLMDSDLSSVQFW